MFNIPILMHESIKKSKYVSKKTLWENQGNYRYKNVSAYSIIV